MTETAEAPPAAGARTLTEALRRLSEADLARLLTLRPDLAYPVPGDISELSAQATTTSSVGRALDGLNAWQRVVAEGLAALPDPVSIVGLSDLLDAGRSDCAAAVDDLRERGLLWGSDELHLVRAVRDQFGPYPGGLAPPSPRPVPDAEIDGLLHDAGPRARPVVERLLWNPVGKVAGAERVVTIETARTPVERLLARRLLRPSGPGTVLLPREIAWQLRGRRFTTEPVATTPPTLSGPNRGPRLVDQAAVGAAYGFVHDVELAVHNLETLQHRLLREGGIAVRDVAAISRALGTEQAHAAFVLETTAAAGLIAAGDAGRLLPTLDYDRWAERQPADRWRTLVAGWRHSQRLPGLSSEPGGHPLGPECEAPGAATVRGLLVDLLAGVEVGTTLDPDAVRRAVDWHLPRLVRVGGVPLDSVLAWTWREAGWLGLLSLDAVSGLAGAAATAETHPVPPALAAAFPATVDRIVLQADLTAIVPGPVPYGLARDLRLLADQESRGGAAVFRFSATSLRRALGAGWSAADVRRWLAQHAATSVPQPLSYLIEDVARRHGSIRVGPASAYVRIADEVQAAAILAHPDAGLLGLRAVAPGILVAAAEPYEIIDFLHRIGHSPAAEDSSGRSITAPEPLRASRRGAHRPRADLQAGDAAVAILAGES
ncbi:MAG TPA: helicase-associated domain-containing protein, partial [Candidatus Nanopelagicales bacterium]|nr:helicase-associated domain-containing protein [Candidatus Nanopelagicales bacterium]